MQISRLVTISYSPTGTTAKTLSAIAEGLGAASVVNHPFTLPAQREKYPEIKPGDLVVIGAPVYSGRIPSDARQFLKGLKAPGVPAVVVAEYGNRAYDSALAELNELAVAAGCTVIAAGAFIGEHSFSDSAHPIAKGRPDSADLAFARQFGVNIADYLEGLESLAEVAALPLPGQSETFVDLERKDRGEAPYTDLDLCIDCGECASNCPTAAIDPDNGYATDVALCTWCMACLRVCPVEARIIEGQRYAATQQKLFDTCQERREPEVFFAS